MSCGKITFRENKDIVDQDQISELCYQMSLVCVSMISIDKQLSCGQLTFKENLDIVDQDQISELCYQMSAVQ